jgi:hypothetical protein
MALPASTDARRFYQAAKQRFEDGGFLLEAGRTTGAIYLAGYSVECMLKALILSRLSARRRIAVLQQFRGRKAHEYGWLQRKYFQSGGQPFPATISKAFALVNTWVVELRYEPGTSKYEDAAAFVDGVEAILLWADGRL